MNYFLYQPPRLNESDVVYCNAELITDSRKRAEVYDKITEIYNGVRSKSYPWFGKKNGYYVLKGLVKDYVFLFKWYEDCGHFAG